MYKLRKRTFPFSAVRKKRAKKIEFRGQSRASHPRGIINNPFNLYLPDDEKAGDQREPHVFWQRDGILDDTIKEKKRKKNDRAGIPVQNQ